MAKSSLASSARDGDGAPARSTAEQRESQRRRHRAPPQQRGDAAAEQRDDDRVDQEQRQRGRQQDSAQVARFGIGVAGAPRLQRRRIERRDAVGRRQRIDRERAVGRPIKSGRMIDGRAVAVSRRAAALRSRAAVRTRQSRRACAAARPFPPVASPATPAPGVRRCSRRYRRSASASRRRCQTSADRTSAYRR